MYFDLGYPVNIQFSLVAK